MNTSRYGVLVICGLVGGLLQLAPMQRSASAQMCPGDCGGDGIVTIEEIILSVNIVNDAAELDDCLALDRDQDGDVAVDDIIAAVSAVLDGCPDVPATRENVILNYANLLYANYGDAIAGAQAVEQAIVSFVDNPSANTLAAAKQAWLDARPAYLQTEAARFYDGPIDNPDDGPEGFINAWPLDESFIDYVEGNPTSGIINDPSTYPDLTAELLASLNEQGGETNIATGWHAIEFLLWGQDRDPAGPGARPFTDYITGGTAANQARRATYLRIVAARLIDDLNQVRDQWAPGQAGNYRAEFLSVDPQEALRRIFTGIGTLSGGELTGERLATAFDTKDQEDEHSCFADNTHVDHRNDQRGIQNLWLGRYGRINGPGLNDLVSAVNAGLAAQTTGQMNAASDAIFGIPVPFDQAILGPYSALGRVAIAASIDALNLQTDLIADSAAALGISISTTVP